MRSQLLILTLISLAVSGCGKEVRRETALGSQQMNPAGNPQLRSTELRPGECGDRIGEPAYKRIERFSDVSQPQGVYDLVSFEAVGQSLSLGSGTAVDGVSVIAATVKAGAVEFTQVCSDLAKMPNQSLDWSVSAPSAMTATNGTITNETAFAQRIYGSAVLDASGKPRAAENSPSEMKATTCQSVTAILNGEGCSPAKIYQMDPTSIGVLRTITTKSATGAIVTSKVFAQYVLVGAATEAPMPDTSTSPGPYEPSSQGTGSQGTGNQGSNANNGNNGNAKKGEKKKVEKKKEEKKAEKKVEKKAGNNSNNSNNVNNGNNANNANNSGNVKNTEKKGTGNQGSNSPGTGNQGAGVQGTGNQGSIYSGTGTVVEFDRVYVAGPAAATPVVVTAPVVVTTPVVVTAPVESSDDAVVVKSKTKTKMKTVEKSESSSLSGDSTMKTKSVTKVKSKTKTKMKKMN